MVKTISFNSNLDYKKAIEQYNKNHNNDLNRWINTGQMVKVEKWLFVGKDELERQKKELECIFRVINFKIIQLNNLQEKIKFEIRVKANEVKERLKNIFDSREERTIKYGLQNICIRIIEQPLHLLEVVEKYPDTLKKNQQIYYRYKYLFGLSTFAKDKFDINMIDFENDIDIQKSKELLNKIFLFIEWFINKLKYYNNSDFDYLKSKPFSHLFSMIIKYKGYYQEVFNSFNFPNIVEAERRLSKSHEEDGNYYYLTCSLSDKTIAEVHKIMTEKKYIKADLIDFLIGFGKKPGKIKKPVTWLIKPGKPNKTALFTFLKMMLCPNNEKFERKFFNIANEVFAPKKIFEKISYPSKSEVKASRVRYFQPIKAIIENN